MTNDLNNLSTQDLGQLFPVFIVEYNPEWKNIFILEKQNIQGAIGIGNIKRLEHIGSTAVPGLCAKPTIDILIEIIDDTNIDLLIKNLNNIQYQYIPKPENPPPHLMMAKGYSKAGITGQTFHIHLRYAGNWDEIVFRDLLIKNPETAFKYGKLKRKLSEKYKNDREKYTESKSDFIKLALKMARDQGLIAHQ